MRWIDGWWGGVWSDMINDASWCDGCVSIYKKCYDCGVDSENRYKW